jgi:diaminopimelate epimerase
MKLAFVKMHGLGNDFVLIDNRSGALDLGREQIRLLADRRRGIGCDQLLMVEPARAAGDVRARIFNQDGSEVGQCGNGLRCLAVYLREAGIASGEDICIEAGQGLVRARFANGKAATVNMGVPDFEPGNIPFTAHARESSYVLQAGAQRLEVGVASLGNPHAVVRVEDCASAPVGELGPLVQSLGEFPEGVNVGFMQVLDNAHVNLRVFERGVGETQACGSGACAAVAIGQLRGWLGARVSVALPGGELMVDWDGEGQPVWLSGPTQRAFEGTFEL